MYTLTFVKSRLVILLLAVTLSSGCFINNNADQSSSLTSFKVRNLPASIDSITLEITAVDMDTITIEDINPIDESYTIEVPAGDARTFSLVITPPSESAVLSYIGETTLDLAAGESVEVSVTMSISETKIIIPDAGNNRIIQKNSLTSTDWTELNGTFFNYTNDFDFFPFDADIDGTGNIYIAAADLNTSGESGIFKITSFSDITPDQIVTDDARAVTVDRVNNRLYYADNTGFIYKCDLSGTQLQAYNVGGSYITGIAYGGGYVYYIDSSAATLYKYNPAGSGSSVNSYSSFLLANWNVDILDVMYKDGKIYVANNEGTTAGYKIMELDTDFNLLNNFGSPPADPNVPIQGELYYPTRFIAVLNKKFTVIDESNDGPIPTKNRLVSFSDLLGSDWETYGTTGSGDDQFYFFNNY